MSNDVVAREQDREWKEAEGQRRFKQFQRSDEAHQEMLREQSEMATAELVGHHEPCWYTVRANWNEMMMHFLTGKPMCEGFWTRCEGFNALGEWQNCDRREFHTHG